MRYHLEQKIKDLPDIEFPSGLHGRIMKRLFFLQFRCNLLIIVTLLTCNAIASGWYVFARIVETEIPSLVSSLLQDFELSRNFFADLVNIITPSFPTGAFLLFSVNFLIMGYSIYAYLSMKKFVNILLHNGRS